MRTLTPVSTPAGTTFERTLRVDRLQYWAGVQHAQVSRDTVSQFAHPAYRLGVWHVREGIVPRVPLAKIHDGSGFIPEYDADKWHHTQARGIPVAAWTKQFSKESA